ncbi:MAG: site-specific integrase [Defluviicoccus sp.]|nr:site-specific integrase [Defluviicoccus sp.]MDE0277275.1 site-specific integrase [Defluviicoccus sp.]
MPGLGVRVRPTGGKSWVMLEETGGRSKRVSLGPVSVKGIEEVRRECLARRVSPMAEPVAPARPVPSFREFVEGEWKAAHFARYKPSTRYIATRLLETRFLPAFGEKPLDRIAPAEIRRWFDAFSRTAPGNANRALDVLRQMMNFAVARGHIETNPTRGIERNRRPRMTRFLSREEIARLHGVLDAEDGKGNREHADIVRLLLLTGCRKNEILRLRWSEVRDDMLELVDSKTGPRKVPLNIHARRILARQPRGEGAFVFPSPRDPDRPRNDNLVFWFRIRKEAGIEDVRLHDLRHTHASHAAMSGVPIPVVSRLLGHSSVRMTLRYAHLGDREIEQAAERVGQAIGSLLEL